MFLAILPAALHDSWHDYRRLHVAAKGRRGANLLLRGTEFCGKGFEMRAFLGAMILTLLAGFGAAAGDRIAEDQTPTGKFLTATETRPILSATKASWISVREFNGQDLIYFTHLLSWRCGLYGVQFAVNGGDLRAFEIPECPPDIDQPNAIPEDVDVYLAFDLGSVKSVTIELLYDDLETDSATYQRAAVLMP